MHGQKGFNGVALLSKLPFDEVAPAARRRSRRRAGALSRGGGLGALGRASRHQHLSAERQSGSPEKFVYKLAWMTRLKERIKTLLANEEPMVIAGDFNVIPTPEDV